MSVLSLPPSLRGALKEPMGPVFEDAAELLADAGDPLVAVGDVVTYHLRRAGRDPDVAVIDGRTERREVSDEIKRALAGDNPRIRVENPPAELTEDLLRALVEAFDRDEPIVIHVDGEEDLATLPAVLAAPSGASVVYGQPGAGMVRVAADADSRAFVRDLLSRMDGDSAAALDILQS